MPYYFRWHLFEYLLLLKNLNFYEISRKKIYRQILMIA